MWWSVVVNRYLDLLNVDNEYYNNSVIKHSSKSTYSELLCYMLFSSRSVTTKDRRSVMTAKAPGSRWNSLAITVYLPSIEATSLSLSTRIKGVMFGGMMLVQKISMAAEVKP